MISDVLKGLKKVGTDCYTIFAPFYEARSKVYKYSAFYQSVTELSARQCFWYKIENQTLLIFKRKSIMGNGSIFLQIAPINLHNDRQTELNYILACYKSGIPAKLNQEDISRYNIPGGKYAPDKGNREYIYDANEYYALTGSKFRSHRNAKRRFEKNDGRFIVGYNDNIRQIVDTWTQEKNSTQTQLFKVIKNNRSDKCSFVTLYTGDTPEAFSFTERISESGGIIVQRLRNYNSTLNDINSVVHYYDCLQFADSNHPKAYLNMGAAVGIHGMSDSKKHLRPCAVIQVYKTTPKHSITKATFQTTKIYFP